MTQLFCLPRPFSFFSLHVLTLKTIFALIFVLNDQKQDVDLGKYQSCPS